MKISNHRITESLNCRMIKQIWYSVILLFGNSVIANAAVPLSWTVETSRAQPATFEAYQGETISFEAALQSYGMPLEAPLNYSFFWQTNGMGNLYWEAPAGPVPSSPTNVLFATWSPTNDVGAKVYNCFIGAPSNIYHAAFQLRLRPSPGALPNVLPLPTPVIDFAKVRVLNPPWESGGGGGVNTNAVRDIAREEIATATNALRKVDGAARPLPRYLHALDFDDSYPDEAEEYYRSRGNGKTEGGCSAVRSGGFLYRNFDYPFDDRAEFVLRVSGNADGRLASVGVAQVGTNLTESLVTSGRPSRWYKALPGATVDGINERGVVAEINVVDGDPATSGWHTGGDIHPLAAVRWALDNGTSAGMVASNLAANIRFPPGWAQNFHYMVADATSTYIVENGSAHLAASSLLEGAVMTNFRLYPTRDTTGAGQERFDLLIGGSNITNAWYTRAYSPLTSPQWVSDLNGIDMNLLFRAWAAKPKELHRGESFGGTNWWQSVHASIYDITNRVLRVAVQEVDDWYTFAVPVTAPKIDAYTKAETDSLLASKIGGDEVQDYEQDPTATARANAAIAAAGCVRTNDTGAVLLFSENPSILFGAVGNLSAMYEDDTSLLTWNGRINAGKLGIQTVGYFTWDGFYEDFTGVKWMFPFMYGYGTNSTHDIALVSQIEAATNGLPEGIMAAAQSALSAGGMAQEAQAAAASAESLAMAAGNLANTAKSEAESAQSYGEATRAMISETNSTFSAAVLAVGLNIDPDTLQWLKDIGAIAQSTTGQVGLGTLLAALLAALMWLKNNKADKSEVDGKADRASIAPEYSSTSAYSVGKFVYHDGNIYQCVSATTGAWDSTKWELRKLDDFFKNSNPLLTATIDAELPIPFASLPADNTTSSYKRFRVTVTDDMTIVLHTPTSGDAEIFECRFDGSGLTADKSISFSTSGATATTMDTDCGTVKAGKIALMSAFWNGTTWDVNWKVEG